MPAKAVLATRVWTQSRCANCAKSRCIALDCGREIRYYRRPFDGDGARPLVAPSQESGPRPISRRSLSPGR